MTEADLDDIAALEIPAAAEGWIGWNRRNYIEHGFGLWVVETHTGAFIGDCGLTMQEVDGTWLVEAGWHVRSDLRRQGYAAEAALAVRAAAKASGVEHLGRDHPAVQHGLPARGGENRTEARAHSR